MIRVNTKFIILTSGVKRSGIIQELLWGTYGQNQGSGWRWGREVGKGGGFGWGRVEEWGENADNCN